MTAIRSAVAAAALLASAGTAQALTIDVLFDDTGDGGVTAPFVGSATLVLDGLGIAFSDVGPRGEDPVADGIYFLGEFAIFQFSATFDNPDFFDAPVSFSEDDLLGGPFDVLVEIRTTPDGRTFGFDTLEGEFEGEGPSVTGGTDFVNIDGALLSFEPEFGSRYFVDASGEFEFVGRSTAPPPNETFGTFGPETSTSEVPVPAALPLMALGLAALGAAARRRKA